MRFPVSLSPSPVREAFEDIRWNHLNLSDSEKSLLRSAEENVLEYTLATQEDATHYVQLLLKVLDQAITPTVVPRSPVRRNVSSTSLESSLRRDEALEVLDTDANVVIAHFAIERLFEVVLCLRSTSESSSFGKVTLASSFYPDGFLLEDWRPLHRIMIRGGSDAFSQRGAAFCLACILAEGLHLQRQHRLFQPVTSVLDSFVSWMTSRLQSSASARSLSIVTPSLTALIVMREVRTEFDKAGGIGYIVRHLRRSSASNNGVTAVQQIYELTFCLWLMSLDVNESTDIRNHFHRDGAIPVLADLVLAAPREKVVRCALATLRNLASCQSDNDGPYTSEGSGQLLSRKAKKHMTGSSFLIEMVGCGLVKSIDLMKERTWSDPEMIEDMTVLHGLLHGAYSELTRWERYLSEVESGHLQWGILHTEKFFKENARRMEGPNGDFAVVKMLIRLASVTTTNLDEEIASIACFDIGEFVRLYPNGRVIATRLGAREVIMQLIELDDSPDLQQQALMCVSKMLVRNWQAVG